MRNLFLFLLTMTFAIPVAAQVQLSRLISDGMVMQRGHDVPVWGWADPGTEVAVTFDGQTYTTQADADGAWRVLLPAMEAGGPYAMTVQGGGTTHEIQDVWVGDVWIASGQSNMEWIMRFVNDAEAEIAAANDPMIRHFKVPQSWATRPEPTLAGGTWEAASPETVANFSAVGYFFARTLREDMDVPIGLINTSWGGSRIEPWMSAEALGLGENAYEEIQAREEANERRILDSLRERIGNDLPTEDAGLVDGVAHWAAPDLDESGWADIAVPSLWEQAGYDGMDGIAWYRTAFDLTADEAASGITLGVGMIDDSDITWVNGQRVGGMEMAYNAVRTYDVPAAALHEGRNVLTVRVEDTGGGGGIYGAPELLYLDAGGERRSLAGTWKFQVGAVSVTLNADKNQQPILLYNKMIYPLLPYPIKGAIWYQGESNANTTEDATAYRDLFADMITSWRNEWGVGDFPFLFVQLANFMQPLTEPGESNWALLRESQHATLALPNTGEAVIIDIGEADDIHPRNKQDVGLRLALAAKKVAYGEDLVYSGPVYKSHEVKDGKVVLSFDHVGGGLMAKGDDLSGFAIAGADGRFVWAEAEIEGDTVVLWSDDVAEPVAVRYAWADNPDTANLYNAEGLPATPFRTDGE